ncbi:hypothetical protein [Saccharopolyspora sp. NPDC002376]
MTGVVSGFVLKLARQSAALTQEKLAEARSWTGVRLFQHLIERLDAGSAHLPLNLHTLHTLIASRPTLLSRSPTVHASLGEALEKLASTDGLNRNERDQLAGLQYALRIANR